MTIQSGIENIDGKAWKDFVDSHPHGTVFQSPEMAELFNLAGKMEPVALACVDYDDNILGILLAVIIRERNGIAGYFSKRTVVYGGPLVQSAVGSRQSAVGSKQSQSLDSGIPYQEKNSTLNTQHSNSPHPIPRTPYPDTSPKAIVDVLLQALIKAVSKRSIFIQFRNFTDQTEYLEVFRKNGFTKLERLNLLVDTSSAGIVKKNMSDSRWRQVRKGLQHGARSREAKNIEEVRVFYDILFDLYKNKVKKPLPEWSFFENFYKLSQDGLKPGIILLVEYQGKIIGGILCPVTPGKVIYEWYVCGLDHEYPGAYPSVIATWSAIDYAIKNNIPQFDFMGVGIPTRPYGVRDFKKRFGGEMVNYGRFPRINNKTLYHIAELGYNVLAVFKRI